MKSRRGFAATLHFSLGGVTVVDPEIIEKKS
jgi:hypothetical protein